MEVVQLYLNNYHRDMEALNVLPPSIEPHASGHIIEQIEYIKKILEAGYAYESCGSVYFDVEKYNRDHNYGKLSGRNIEDLLNTTRALDGQDEKHNPLDFALWKKASPEHIMHWPSPWSEGFPGWHLECSTMGTKYLGDTFDIHGGGMDLMFPHHECEIAQSVAAQGHEAVHYWMHNNMITINGKKMGKSYNNFITLEQFFNGNHPALAQAYAPMVIRFFILQAQYRSTIDFSNEALQASEKALQKMLDGYRRLQNLLPAEKSTVELPDFMTACFEAMDDDLNTPMVIAHLFEACKYINQASDGTIKLSGNDISLLRHIFDLFLVELLGIKVVAEGTDSKSAKAFEGAVDLLMEIRANAKSAKDWATSDLIRDKLAELGFTVKDTKNGVEWSLNS
jgi:cysteinyl-tRNA synthetase